MAAIAAIIFFILAALGDNKVFSYETMIAIGLACLALAFLVGNWPIGAFSRRP